MATLYTEAFTYANGTLWTDAGWTKVFGSLVTAFIAEINTNKGIGSDGPTNDESVYRLMHPAMFHNYKTKVTLKWNDAVGTSRVRGVGVRVQANGDGYYLDVDSNFDDPRYRVRRRANGTWTDLVAWTDLAGHTGSSLNTGIVVMLRVENGDDSVDLDAFITSLTVPVTSYSDTNATRIQTGQYSGIYDGATTHTTDISADDVTCLDFEDELAPSAPFTTGVAMVVNGTYYDTAGLLALNITPRRAVQSYVPSGPVAVISDENDAHEAVLHEGDWVEVHFNGEVLATGVLRSKRQRFDPAEGTDYEVVGPRELADEVYLEDDDFSGFYAYNYDEDSEFYKEERSNKELGEALKEVYDRAADGEDGLRIRGAAPATGALYVQAELDLLDVKVPNLTVSGTVLQAEESLLAYMPEYAIWVDPLTRIRHVHKRSVSPSVNVKTSEHHVRANILRDLRKNRTVVVIIGSAPDVEESTFLFEEGDRPSATLIPGWDDGVEGTWGDDKVFKSQAVYTVAAAGIDGGGNAYIEINTGSGYSMDIDEWKNTKLVHMTSIYKVSTNSAVRLTLFQTAWGPDGQPSVGHTITVMSGGGDPDYENNQHSAAFREFILDGAQAKPGFCGKAKVTQTLPTGQQVQYDVRTEVLRTENSGESRVKLELPAIGLVNYLPDVCGNGENPTPAADRIELTVPTAPVTPGIPKLRVPASGFRGTAYSQNEDLWDGGGPPEDGDGKCRIPIRMEIPQFQSLSLQGAEYTKVADSMLAVYGTMAFEGDFTFGAVEVGWAGLDRKVTWEDDLRGRDTGFEASPDLWVLQVEWDLFEESTIVRVGTLSSQGIDLDAQRKRYAEKTRLDLLRRQRRLAEELRNCIENAVSGSGAAGGLNPNPVCASRVVYTKGPNTPGPPIIPIPLKFDITQKGLDVLIGLEEEQKGFDITYNVVNGVWEGTDKHGNTWTWFPDSNEYGGGHWKRNSDDFTSRRPFGESDDSPAKPDLPGGMFGELWAALLWLAKNAGKTLPAPGDDNADAGKEPGDDVDQGGGEEGIYQGADGTSHVLGDDGGDDKVPASALSHIHAFASLKGLTPYDLEDPGGYVFASPDGKFWRAVHATAGVYADGVSFQEVEAVTAGTGQNDGDYDIPASPVDLKTFVHKQFHELYGQTMANGAVLGSERHAMPAGPAGFAGGKVTYTLTGLSSSDPGAFSLESRFAAPGDTVPAYSSHGDGVMDPASPGANEVFTVTWEVDVTSSGLGGVIQLRVTRDSSGSGDVTIYDVAADVPVVGNVKPA